MKRSPRKLVLSRETIARLDLVVAAAEPPTNTDTDFCPKQPYSGQITCGPLDCTA